MGESRKRNRQEVLDALAKYQRRDGVSIDDAMLNHMVAEESDRGLVIILGSWIEDALADRIFDVLPAMTEDEQNTLTRSGAPLRDFNARITMAKALSLIDNDVADSIHIVRAMRNACSHSRHEIQFTTPQLKDTLLLLFDDKSREEIAQARSETTLQIAFISVVGYILGRIMGETREAAQRRINVVIAEATEEAHPLAERPQALPETQSDTQLPDFRRPPTDKGR